MGSFAPKGHARVDPQRPAAFAICDRCGFMYNHRELVWDTQYMGRFIKRTGFLVCESCNDRPNPTLRPIKLPPDPVPILNPRSEPIHCHTFKPRADQLQDIPLDGFPSSVTADTSNRQFPPVDMFRDVTVDSGSVCDTRTYKDGFSVPVPPKPPEPLPCIPLLKEDAWASTIKVDATNNCTHADISPIFPPVEIEGNTADTDMVLADNGDKLVNTFPNYQWAADLTTPTVDDIAAVTADAQT